jgi:hypothetical protein
MNYINWCIFCLLTVQIKKRALVRTKKDQFSKD